MTEVRPFQVDLRGVVDLLGRHIYSSPRVFLRELLQNGVDAITARAAFERQRGGTPDPAWGITIHPTGPSWPHFALVDQGIGLTLDEVTELLATVGRSSKRDILDLARSDYLGQFGIGLLSCFMVSDQIRILSQSAGGEPGIEWIGSGEGTFEVRSLTTALPVGTQVYLAARFDSADLLSVDAVTDLARQYGRYLSVPIDIAVAAAPGAPGARNPATGASQPGDPTTAAGLDQPYLAGTAPIEATVRINDQPVFRDDQPDPAVLADYCRGQLGFDPLDTIALSAPGTSTKGQGFVLPFAPPPNARQSARVYLGGMLLSERVDDLLPDWAFFVRAVVDSTGLTPTASREGLVEDYAVEYTRDQLGACVRQWLTDLALHQPHRFAAFLSVHQPAIKQLVLHDEAMARIFLGWLSVETSAGRMTIERLVKLSPTVRYVATLDEYRQIAGLSADANPLVNGGYVYDTDLIGLLPRIYPGVSVVQVDVLAELDQLDPPALDDRAVTVALEDRASAVLKPRQCQAVVRIMTSPDLPALYVADPEVFRHIDRGRATSGTGIWADILAQTDQHALSRQRYDRWDLAARLCLNWANPLVRRLAHLDDPVVLERCVQLLYIQSQLAGSFVLTAADRRLMTSALSDLIDLTTTPIT